MANGKSQLTINTVFVVSMAACAGIGVWGVVDPDGMTGAALGFTNYALTGVSWGWLALCTGFLFLAAFMAFGPYGAYPARQGRRGTGIWHGLVDRDVVRGAAWDPACWSGARPSQCTTGRARRAWRAGPAAAARQALVITNLHWGFHAWAIYACCALVIAYFTFRKNRSSMISTPIRALFQALPASRWARLPISWRFFRSFSGLAGSLAMGVLSLRNGMGFAFDTAQTSTNSMFILAALLVCYMLSATTGVDKGIKILLQT